MFKKSDKNLVRKAKHDRIRNTLSGTKEQPNRIGKDSGTKMMPLSCFIIAFHLDRDLYGSAGYPHIVQQSVRPRRRSRSLP